MLEWITQEFTFIAEELWNKYSKLVNITEYSKTWQNEKWNRNLVIYQTFRRRIDWIKYKKSVKMAKKIFFDSRIQEIASTNKRT